ncbi:hypothetical protein [Ferrimicrobium acidiphilum]|uniref:hypothetical protein n=1 Tax=Ferrimicrobium acidiphilum TaxID=121039 RepID=UPI0023F2916A|nr:hypothetical protein [Ferrimicrobium acidiphilum]
MSMKDTALAMVEEAGARHVAQELAASASLSDDHPTWAIIAMVGSVLGKANADQQALLAEIRRLDDAVRRLELQIGSGSGDRYGIGGGGAIAGSLGDLTHELADMKRKVSASLEDNALLSQKMPGFLSRLEDVLVAMKRDIEILVHRTGG